MIGRQVVWSKPEIQKLASEFIPAADEVYLLQTGKGPEARLFQKIAEQQKSDGPSRQGIYAATPSGILLGYNNTPQWPEGLEKMLKKAMAEWQKLPGEKRLQAKEPEKNPSNRFRLEKYYPKDGLVLNVFSRDLPRERKFNDWRENAWNKDFAWFKNDEAKAFVPERRQAGVKHNVPDAMVRRIARAHIVDNVRGQTLSYEDKHIVKAALQSEVTKVKDGVVSLRLTGETHTQAKGKWPVDDFKDAKNPKMQERGFKTALLGFAEYDTRQEKFVSFEMIALGTRWGGTQYNERADDLEPSQAAIAFTLAGNSPSDKVAPAFIWSYGDDFMKD